MDAECTWVCYSFRTLEVLKSLSGEKTFFYMRLDESEKAQLRRGGVLRECRRTRMRAAPRHGGGIQFEADSRRRTATHGRWRSGIELLPFIML
jgi:hypothetical protein